MPERRPIGMQLRPSRQHTEQPMVNALGERGERAARTGSVDGLRTMPHSDMRDDGGSQPRFREPIVFGLQRPARRLELQMKNCQSILVMALDPSQGPGKHLAAD